MLTRWYCIYVVDVVYLINVRSIFQYFLRRIVEFNWRKVIKFVKWCVAFYIHKQLVTWLYCTNVLVFHEKLCLCGRVKISGQFLRLRILIILLLLDVGVHIIHSKKLGEFNDFLIFSHFCLIRNEIKCILLCYCNCIRCIFVQWAH